MENKNYDTPENEQKLLKQAEKIGLPVGHPTFKPEDFEVLKKLPLKDLYEQDEIALYLRIRENVRRYVLGKGQHYLYAAIRLFGRLQDQIVDDKLNLTTTYGQRPDQTGTVILSKLNEGDKNDEGFLYVPYFRAYYPPEEFGLVAKIGKLKGTWNNMTLSEGKTFGDVAAYRNQCLYDGTADDLVASFGLPLNYVKKLTTGYVARNQ